MNIVYGRTSRLKARSSCGKPVEMSNPNDAIQLGIGMVFQHFNWCRS